jgi:cytidylate kinase
MGVIIAIDGPGGVGKSTISFKIAEYFNYMLIDTGAMYRAVALLALKNNISFDSDEILKLAENLEFSFLRKNNKNLIFVDSVDFSNLIRTPEISKNASKVAKNGKLRKILVEKQREIAKKNSVVIEGRDIGTVVFPNADIKLFLTALPEIRAQRRFKELKEKGLEVDFETVLEDIKSRDYNDTHRKESPLLKADDAILIDTGNMTIKEVSDKVIEVIKLKLETKGVNS